MAVDKYGGYYTAETRKDFSTLQEIPDFLNEKAEG